MLWSSVTELQHWISSCLDIPSTLLKQNKANSQSPRKIFSREKRPPDVYWNGLTSSRTFAGAATGRAAAAAALRAARPHRATPSAAHRSVSGHSTIHTGLPAESKDNATPHHVLPPNRTFCLLSGGFWPAHPHYTLPKVTSLWLHESFASSHQPRRSTPVWRMRSPAGISLLAAQSKIAQTAASGKKVWRTMCFLVSSLILMQSY